MPPSSSEGPPTSADTPLPENRAEQLSLVQRRLGYTFRDLSVLDQALTHSSYAHEGRYPNAHNERMEFLGDAVLDLILRHQYFEEIPSADEGKLSKIRSHLVSARHLARMARALEIGPHIRLGKGERSTGGRHKASILANAFEALVAALFLDAGYEKTAMLVRKLFDREMQPLTDFKSLLQERLQRERRPAPDYLLFQEYGPEHEKTYEVAVQVEGETLAVGKGQSKKLAEQQAAREGLEKLSS
jgi:ribonuclease-3